MNFQHKQLAEKNWVKLSFFQQMANIGSEVERALKWKEKGNNSYSMNAFERALELLDLTLDSVNTFPRRKEVARVREALVDYFFGTNQFKSSPESWRSYFWHFNYAARKNH